MREKGWASKKEGVDIEMKEEKREKERVKWNKDRDRVCL